MLKWQNRKNMFDTDLIVCLIWNKTNGCLLLENHFKSFRNGFSSENSNESETFWFPFLSANRNQTLNEIAEYHLQVHSKPIHFIFQSFRIF